jgi:tetratricopeptide (TPR) repeat protein
MESKDNQKQLSRGIDAVQRGNRAEAVDILFGVVESDRENEQAWFWLSRAVESDEQKRICLENVLILDPENEVAIEELDKISSRKVDINLNQNYKVVERDVIALSPAAAILYPDRLVKKWQWQDTVSVHEAPEITYIPFSRYDDIWERENDLCAYCSAEVHQESARCPVCRRRLTVSHHSEPKASGNLIVFFVLVLAVGQLFFIQIFLDIIVGNQLTAIVWHGFIFCVVILLSVLIAIRHPAGYVGAILLLLIILTILIVEWLTGASIDSAISTLSGEDYFLQIAESPFLTLASPLLDFIRPFQIITIILALLYGILAVGPDFEKSRFRLVARIDKGLFEASDYFTVGKRYAQNGMWASAILHFKMAVAKEPTRPAFQRSLGFAYAELGFFERALDVLESVKDLSSHPGFKKSILEKIDSVRDEISDR